MRGIPMDTIFMPLLPLLIFHFNFQINLKQNLKTITLNLPFQLSNSSQG